MQPALPCQWHSSFSTKRTKNKWHHADRPSYDGKSPASSVRLSAASAAGRTGWVGGTWSTSAASESSGVTRGDRCCDTDCVGDEVGVGNGVGTRGLSSLMYTQQSHIHDNSHINASTWSMESRFKSHPTQNRSFRRHSSQTFSWLSTEKLNQTEQKQTCIHNNIYYNIKWTQKTKATFGHLLWPPASETNWAYSGRKCKHLTKYSPSKRPISARSIQFMPFSWAVKNVCKLVSC